MKNDEDPCSDDASESRRRRPRARRNAAPCSPSSRSGRTRSARSWGWPATAPTTTTSVSPEHRCYAFGDPAELSAEQQQKVCLQPGYGNCPRYLRGVLVIPTEELEALRHPQPLPAAGSCRGRGGRQGRARSGVDAAAGSSATVVLVLLIVGAAAGGGYWYLRNQVPSSAVAAALPGGTDLSAELLSLSEPEGDSQSVTAQAAIGGAAPVPDTTLVYVIDLSRTTLEGPGCGGDPNRDGLVDTPLDCEIAAATALNAQAVENGTVGAVGLVGFAGGATTADLSPEEGIQVLTAPAQDDDQDGITNVVEALESAYSARRRRAGGLQGLHARSAPRRARRSSAPASTAACQVMDEADTANRLVVFLSDGRNRSGDPLASVLPCDAATVFQTFAAGAEATLRAGVRAGWPAGDRRPDRRAMHHGCGPDAAAVDPGVGGVAPDPAHPAGPGWRRPHRHQS